MAEGAIEAIGIGTVEGFYFPVQLSARPPTVWRTLRTRRIEGSPPEKRKANRLREAVRKVIPRDDQIQGWD
jgi:hypothetical protein